MKKLFLLMLVLIAVPMAFAYNVNEAMDINAIYSEDGVPTPIEYANVWVVDPANDVVVNGENMTNLGNGTFNYIFTPETIGKYEVTVRFYNSTLDLRGVTLGYLSVGVIDKLEFGKCPETEQGQKNMWFLVGFVILLAVVGLFKNIPILVIFSGAALIFISLITWGCGAVIGYVTMISGVILILIALSIRTD